VPAVVETPPALAIASLKPPVPVSADSDRVAAFVMIARSDADTPFRFD
jgi:hypothetical protein